MSYFDKAILTVLKHEGGYVDDPADPGGATNYGVSIRYLKDHGDLDGDGLLDGDIDMDGDVDADDIRAMDVEDAKRIYKLGFWDKNKIDNLNDYIIAERYFDMVVNMGPRQAGKIIQRACNYFGKGLVVDGIAGPATFGAANSLDPEKLLREIRFNHAKFYLDLVEKRPTLGKFINGWLRRAVS
jgi:lysozyme family protein